MTEVDIKLIALKGSLHAMQDTVEAYNLGELELDRETSYYLHQEINECEAHIRVLTMG